MLKKLLLLFPLVMGACFADNTCSNSAPISISTSGTTQIIAPVSGMSLHICKISFSASAQTNITITATGTASNISGTYPNILSFSENFEGGLRTGKGNGLGINSSAAVTIGGVVTYDVVLSQ